MATNKATLASDLYHAFESVMYDESDDREGALRKLTQNLAEVFVKAILSADIEYLGGLTNTGGPVTGTFEGKLR